MQKKKTKTELRKAIGTRVPILAPGIGTRIDAASKAIGTRAEAAQVGGVSDDMLYRYIREESPPSFSFMVGISQKSGYSLSWLATGEGPERITNQVGEPHAAYQALPESFDKRMDRLQWATRLVKQESKPLGLDPSDRLHTTLVGLVFEGLLDPRGLQVLISNLVETFNRIKLQTAADAMKQIESGKSGGMPFFKED